MIPHAWMFKASILIWTAPTIIALLTSTIIDQKTELLSQDTNLGEVNIKRGIFRGDSWSRLLFIISLTPLTI